MSEYQNDLTEARPSSVSPADDSRVLQLSRDYLAELESGRVPDRQAFVNQFPELKMAVEECLDGLEIVHAMANPMSRSNETTIGFGAEPLGDFRIVREIGRGGMGIVYEAIQLSLGRRVALKVLPFAAALDERQRARFQLESHAAAQLHHNHIVPVYAVGCDRGTHYYAMQLVNGKTVAELIEQLKSTANQSGLRAHEETSAINATPTIGDGDARHSHLTKDVRRNRFQATARLIAQIADALEYAHVAGIIHRDVKPANILIDAHGDGWITDFGLAQITANAAMTQTGDLVGTLRYMSPEQAAGRRGLVDQRTDIYALGATMYELASLRPIFLGDDRQSLLNSILNVDPPLLRTIDRTIPVELETIIHKTISKSPVDRYGTAGELAADLRRFLEQRPILARRPNLIDRTRKWGRRHPALVSVSLAALVLGFIGLSIGMTIISVEQSTTRAALGREQLRTQEAEARMHMAQQAADAMIDIAEFELSNNPFEDGLRKKLLESAVVQYQRFIDERSDQPVIQAELKETRDRIGKILAGLSLLETQRESNLLRVPEVLIELKIDAAQNEQISDFLDSQGRQIGAIMGDRQLSSAEVHASMLKVAAENQQKMAGLLSEHQTHRLKQLAFQYLGLRAFHESTVIEALQLTDEQRARLRVIESELRFRPGPPPPRFAGGPPSQPRMSPAPFEERGSPQNRGPRNGPASQPDQRGDGPPRNVFFPNLPPGPMGRDGNRQQDDRQSLEKFLAELSDFQLQQWQSLIGKPVAIE